LILNEVMKIKLKRKDINLPNSAYVVDVSNPERLHYEVYYKGKKINNVICIVIDEVLKQ